MIQTHEKYINRELSWLEFNQRVLDEANDDSLPLLERLKFLAITASNLDEFFRVRFGGLQVLAWQGSTRCDPSGMTPHEQVRAISLRASEMISEMNRIFLEEVEPQLAETGIQRMSVAQLETEQLDIINSWLVDEASAVLGPIAVGSGRKWPHLSNLTINLCVRIGVNQDKPGTLVPPADEDEVTERFAIIPVGDAVSRIMPVPSDGGYQYVLCEDALALFAERFFPGQEVLECVPFRITRNADMGVREDSAGDLLQGMTEVLDAREDSQCVRLEIAASASETMVDFLAHQLDIQHHQIFNCRGPLDLSAYFRLAGIHGYDDLKIEEWPPQATPEIDPSESIFETISRKDVLLCHPYESFDPVVRFVEEAACDPDVLSIKQILYRTSRKSPIVAALRQAAENGKNVTVLVELKARFDEARNIRWARQLEQDGVHVIYGVKGLKTHAKLCVVVRRESDGIHRYMHFGTGNYNEATARIYSDISLMTKDEDLGQDAINFFNAICGYSQPQAMRKLVNAPTGLRDRLLELIEVEIQATQQGHPGRIRAKVNSLVDTELIDALYSASQAGVKIELNVRGICCLRPGIEGLSENIRVVSIVDRFLEHARIICFHHGGEERMLISSADWMQRNLDKRVELLVPVEDPLHIRRLNGILDTYFNDNVKARILLSDGTFRSAKDHNNGKQNRKPVRSQFELYRATCEAVQRAKREQLTTFQPHQATVAD